VRPYHVAIDRSGAANLVSIYRDYLRGPAIRIHAHTLLLVEPLTLAHQGPGQRLYSLAQHVTQKRQAAIEHAKPSVLGAVRPESALLELSCRLHLDAEKRKIKLEESRLAMLSAEENAAEQRPRSMLPRIYFSESN
jgi:hypothetical protein